MKSKKCLRKMFAWFMLGIFIFDHALAAFAAAGTTLNINFIAVNASDQAQSLEINQPLPKELNPEDVLDTGNLKLQYDLDKKVYYVKGKVDFQSKESKTFKIKVNDVWYIKPEEIEMLKKQLAQNVDTLKDNENYSAALEAKDDLDRQLDVVLSQQNSYSDNIERRIEEYRAYRETLEQVRNNIYSIDYLRYESKSLKETRDNAKTVKFEIEVKNPSETEERKVTQKHYLPDEVRAADVVDKKDFDIRFDEVKNRAYLTKEETFAPGETKKYEIVIKDIWRFPLIKAQDLDERVQIAVGELEGTIYEESAGYLVGKIKQSLEEIRATPTSGISIENHIGVYRVNEKRYTEAWQDFKRIEEMIAIVRAKKLEQLTKSKVKNVLQRLKALRGLRALSEMLFKKQISVTTTWKIIFGTIIFVAVFTTIHFFIWAKRSGKQGEESAQGEVRVVPKPGQSETEAKGA